MIPLFPGIPAETRVAILAKSIEGLAPSSALSPSLQSSSLSTNLEVPVQAKY